MAIQWRDCQNGELRHNVSGYAEVDRCILAKNMLISLTDEDALNWDETRFYIVFLIAFTQFSIRRLGGIEGRINIYKNLVIADRQFMFKGCCCNPVSIEGSIPESTGAEQAIGFTAGLE